MPNSNVGWMGIERFSNYTLCAAEPNSKWKPHSITVRSVESGDIKYKIWMSREGNPREYYSRLASSWGDNASFDFYNIDNSFIKIKYLENKSRYALFRLQYPYELRDDRRGVFERYLKKNSAEIVQLCVFEENIELLKEFTEYIDIAGIKKEKLDKLIRESNEEIKDYLGTFANA